MEKQRQPPFVQSVSTSRQMHSLPLTPRKSDQCAFFPQVSPFLLIRPTCRPPADIVLSFLLRLRPEYIRVHQRIEHLDRRRAALTYAFRSSRSQSEHKNPIRELMRVCLLDNITLIAVWS
jgi:hypothetical protein